MATGFLCFIPVVATGFQCFPSSSDWRVLNLPIPVVAKDACMAEPESGSETSCVRTLDVTVYLVGRPDRYGCALMGAGNFRCIYENIAKSHEI